MADVIRGYPRTFLQRMANLDSQMIWKLIISSNQHVDLTETSGAPSSRHAPDHIHVYLPCYPLKGSLDRWSTIKCALHGLMHGCETDVCGKRLQEMIMSYNSSYKTRDFDGLLSYFHDLEHSRQLEVCATLRKMATVAFDIEKTFPTMIPFLKQEMNVSVTLSKKQIACLLSHAFFCTFPMRNVEASEDFPLPSINFIGLFSSTKPVTMSKLDCLLHYFNRVTNSMPRGHLVFKRQSTNNSSRDWSKVKTRFTELHVSSSGTIEEENGLLQVDFANRFVGGGVLGRGCVQEEILFLIAPELIVSRLFTEVLQDDEVLIMTGSEIYSRHKGYADTFEWTGNYVDRTASVNGVKLTQIVAMDALRFDRDEDQFEEEEINRELSKSYTGFHSDYKTHVHLPAVSTGNWGCGAFGGDKHLKSLLQMMAAAVAGRDVCYFTYGDKELALKMWQVHDLIKSSNLSVGAVYRTVMDYVDHLKSHRSHSSSIKLYDFILKMHSSKSSLGRGKHLFED